MTRCMLRVPSTSVALLVSLGLAGCATTPVPGPPAPPPPPRPADTVPGGIPVPVPVPPPAAAPGSFPAWLTAYRAGAVARGVASTTLESLFAGMTSSDRVIELDRAQPGDSGATPARFDAYLARRLDASRINGGRAAAERSSAATAVMVPAWPTPG